MKKLILLLVSSILFLQAGTRSLISKIPLPENIVIDMYEKLKCDQVCLERLWDRGEYFTFLSIYAKSDDVDYKFKDRFEKLRVALNIKSPNFYSINFANFQSDTNMRVALLVPRKVVGKYSISVANSILAYLIYKNIKFDFEVFDSIDERQESLKKTLFDIKTKGYKFVIAALTIDGANIVSAYERDLLVFIPTVNQKNIQNRGDNILFGGIDYQEQIDVLLGFANDKIAIFDDKSRLAQTISQAIKESSDAQIVYEQSIDNIKANISYMIKDNEILNDSTIFLNLPIVKSALVASQLRYYKIKPYALLSTQVNYHPMLFTLTQRDDIKDLYIANSILNQDKKLKEINIILGTNPSYSWIDYSTAIGIDYIYTKLVSMDAYRLFLESIENNQIMYQIQVFKPRNFGFEQITF